MDTTTIHLGLQVFFIITCVASWLFWKCSEPTQHSPLQGAVHSVIEGFLATMVLFVMIAGMCFFYTQAHSHSQSPTHSKMALDTHATAHMTIRHTA